MDYAPAKLAVGDALDPRLALHLYDVPDRLIFDHLELLRRRLPIIELLALLQQLHRALQGANVLRAERRVELGRGRHFGSVSVKLEPEGTRRDVFTHSLRQSVGV